MVKFWHHLFLVERVSISLAFFRIAIAITVGMHVLPTFMHLDENFYQGALTSINTSFFPMSILEWVAQLPDWVVIACVWGFMMSWLMYLVGLFTQVAGICLTLCCYFFYAKNSFYIGTLSWDILLVTMVLMCMTPYPGDYFSLDYLRQQKYLTYQRLRPFFIQRLLQIQIASIYFYTALYKISAQGNWITGNPLHYLMNYPPQGVIKNFLFKEWLASQPYLCYFLGCVIVLIELLMPLMLFLKRTRYWAIAVGFIFHLILLLTMDVPSIFFFLFPAQLLLFISPQEIERWIKEKQRISSYLPKVKVIIDGECGFCVASVKYLEKMDLWNRLEIVDAHKIIPEELHPELTRDRLLKAMHVMEPMMRLSCGFDAFRRLCWYLPMLYPCILLIYFPGIRYIGSRLYTFIARNRRVLSMSCERGGCQR